MKNAVVVTGELAVIFLLYKGETMECLVDSCDLALLDPYHWYAAWNKSNRSFYAKAHDVRNPGKKKLRMHRLLLHPPDGMDVDHENHNTLDNRRSCNLKIATRSINGLNRKGVQANNTSGHRGVYWNAKRGKWKAKVVVDGKDFHFGFYSDQDEASAAVKSGMAEVIANGGSRASRVCQNKKCGVSFQPHMNNQKYCCKKCTDSAYLQSKGDKKK